MSDHENHEKIKKYDEYVQKRRLADATVVKKFMNQKDQLEIGVERKSSKRTQEILSDKKEEVITELDWRTQLLKAVNEMEKVPSAREMSEDDIRNEGYSWAVQIAITFHGKVFKAAKANSDKEMVAITIDMTTLDPLFDRLFRNHSLKALRFISKVGFRNLIIIHELFLVKKMKIILFQEHLKVNFDEWMMAREEKVSERTVKTFTEAVANAINYLNNIGIVHQNVKPQNIYITEGDVVKLGSLEYVKIIWSLETNNVKMQVYRKKIPAGRSVPPEVTSGTTYDPTKVDVYSLGIFLCFLVLKRYPYDSLKKEDLKIQWTSAYYELRKSLGFLALDLVSRCVHNDPTKRADIREVIVHPFFTSSL